MEPPGHSRVLRGIKRQAFAPNPAASFREQCLALHWR